MSSIEFPPASAAGDVVSGQRIVRGSCLLTAGGSGPVWRVMHGTFRLERPVYGDKSIVHLANAGDCIGVETLCGEPYAYTVTALLDSEAVAMPVSMQREDLLAHALMQMQRQSFDMVRLRSGPVVARLTHLLALLGFQSQAEQKVLDRRALPFLKDMALIVDSAPETVCRELNRLVPARVKRLSVRPKAPWFEFAPAAVPAC